MAHFEPRVSRRSLLLSGLALAHLHAEGAKGATYSSQLQRYSDPLTEFVVYRLTDPAASSALPAYYNRAIARSNSALLYTSDRVGSPQAFRMDLKTGDSRQLTDVEAIDPESLT